MAHTGDIVDRVSVEFLVAARPPPWPTPLALRPGRLARSGRSCMAALSGWTLKLYSPLAVTVVMLICLGSTTRPLVPQILDNLQALALWCVAGINLLTGYVCMRLHMSAGMDVAGYGGGGTGASGAGTAAAAGSAAGGMKAGAAFVAAKTLAVMGPPVGQPGAAGSTSSDGASEDSTILDPRTSFLPRYRAAAELQLGPVFARRAPAPAPAGGASSTAAATKPAAGASSARSAAAAAPAAAAPQGDEVLFIDEGAADLRVLPPIVLEDGTILPPTVLGQPAAAPAAAAPAAESGAPGPLHGFDYYTETRHGWMVRGLLALVPTDLDCLTSCSKRRCWRWRGCRSCGRLSWKRGWLYACPCTRACCTDEGCTASEGKSASMQTLVLASTAALVVSGIFLPFVAARTLPACTEHAGSLALLLFPGGSALLLGTTSLMGFGRKLREPPAFEGDAGSSSEGSSGVGAKGSAEAETANAQSAVSETPVVPGPAAKDAASTAAATNAAAALFMTAWRGAVRVAVLAELPLRLTWVRLLAHRSATLLALFALLTVPLFAGALEASPIPGLDGSARPTAGLDVGRSTGVLLAIMVVPLAVGAGIARAGAIPPGAAASSARVCQSVPVKGTGLAAYLSRVSSLLFSFTRLVPVPLTQPIDVAGFYDVVRHPATRAAFTGVPGCPGANPPAALPRTGLARLLLGPGGEAAPRALSSYPLLAICCVAVLSPAQWRHRIRFLLPASFRTAVRRALCGVPSGVTPEEEPNLYMAWWAWLTRVFNVESTLNVVSEVLTWIALAMVLGNAPAAARASVLAPDFTAPATPELGPCPTGITWAMRVPIYQYAAVSCVLLAYITAMTCWMLLGVARPSRVSAGAAAKGALPAAAGGGASTAAAGAGKSATPSAQLVTSPGGVQEAVSAVSLQSAIVFALTLPRKSLAAGLCLAWCLLSKDMGWDTADTAARDALYRFRVQIATAYGVYHVISSLYIVVLQWVIHNTLLKQRFSYLRRGVERGTAAKLAAARAGLAAGFTSAVRAKVAERALSRLKQHRSSIASVATTSRSITSRLALGDTQRSHVLAAEAAAERLPRGLGVSSRGGGFASDRDGLGSDGSDGEALHSASARSSSSSAGGGGLPAVEGLPKPKQETGPSKGFDSKTNNSNNSTALSLLGNASATAAAAVAAATLSTALASRPASVRLSLPKLAPLAPLPVVPVGGKDEAGAATPSVTVAAPAPATSGAGAQAAPGVAVVAGSALPAAVTAATLAAQAVLPAALSTGIPAPAELLKLKEAASALSSYVELLSATLPAGGAPQSGADGVNVDKLPQNSAAQLLPVVQQPVGLPTPVAAAPPVLAPALGPFPQFPAGAAAAPAAYIEQSALHVPPAAVDVLRVELPSNYMPWPEQFGHGTAATATVDRTTTMAPQDGHAWSAPRTPAPQQVTVTEPLAPSSPGRFLADMSVPVPIKVETPATRSRKQPKNTHTLSAASTGGRAAPSAASAQTLAALGRLQSMAAAGGPAGPVPGHVLQPRQVPLSAAAASSSAAPVFTASTAQVPPVMKAAVSLRGQAAARKAPVEATSVPPPAAANPYAYRPVSAQTGVASGTVASNSGFANPFGPSSARTTADDTAVRQSLETTMALIAASYSPVAGGGGRSRKAATVKASDLTPVVPPHVPSSIVRGGSDGLGLRSDIAATFQQGTAASTPAAGSGAGSAAPAFARAAPAPVHRSIAGDQFLRKEASGPGAAGPKSKQLNEGEAPLYQQYLPKAAPQKVSDNSSLLVGTSLAGPGRRSSADGASHEVAIPAPPSRASLHPAPKAAFSASASARGSGGVY